MPSPDMQRGYDPPESSDDSPVKALYAELVEYREPFLDRARDAALLTQPYLVPEEDHGPDDEFVTPYQSVGAKAVNNLSGKLLDGLFPAGQNFFRLDLDPFVARDLAAQAETDEAAEQILNETIQSIIAARRAIVLELDSSGTRSRMFDAFKHLIVSGNALLLHPEEGEVQVYPLSNFVVERGGDGEVLAIILHETINAVTLDPEIREELGESLSDEEADGKKELDVYTAIYRQGEDKFVQFQEIADKWFDFNGNSVTDFEELDPVLEAELSWRALRFSSAPGEDYGRGLVEEYIGALTTVEALSEALTHGSINAAKLLCMVDPAGMTDMRQIQRAANGDVIPGRQIDVEFLQQGKGSDYAFVASFLDRQEQVVNRAFLVGDGIQRDKERVTAEEIRMLIRELQHGLGGVFGLLSRELQFPVIQFIKRKLERQKRIPIVNGEAVKLRVVTGFEAMGQDQDLDRLRSFIGTVVEVLGDRALPYFKVRGLILELANAAGVEVGDFLHSEEEVQQELQRQQMLALADKAVAPVAGAVAGAATPQAG